MRGDKKDLTGIKFNRIEVISKTNNTTGLYYNWLCRCNCGVEKEISAYNILYNQPKSCGCYERELNSRKNRIGERYGKLVIIDSIPNNRKRFLVRCDCGTIKEINYSNLRLSTKSCGCWLKERAKWVIPGTRKSFGVSARNTIMSGYIRGAKDRNLSWSLNDEDFDKITKSNCHYCGIEPYRKRQNYEGSGFYIYNGIDRVDNNRGYSIDNVVPCCKVCNRAKDIMSQNEFIEWAKRVAFNFITPNKQIFYENNNQREREAKTN